MLQVNLEDEPDYQEGFCVEYAIALLEDEQRRGNGALAIEVGIGERRDEIVNIHAVVAYLDAEADSAGVFGLGYLCDRCDRWLEVERSNGESYGCATYEIYSFPTVTELRAHFKEWGLPISDSVAEQVSLTFLQLRH